MLYQLSYARMATARGSTVSQVIANSRKLQGVTRAVIVIGSVGARALTCTVSHRFVP